MIDVSPLTHMSQQQPVPADTPKPVQPVQPVEKSHGAQSGGARDSGEDGVANSLKANTIRGGDTSLQFRIDQDHGGRLVVSLLDKEGEVVRQIPSELMLKIAQRIEQIQSKGYMGLDARV